LQVFKCLWRLLEVAGTFNALQNFKQSMGMDASASEIHIGALLQD